MAHLLSRRSVALLVWFSVLFCCVANREVIGIAVYPQQMHDFSMKDQLNRVDENDLFTTEDGTTIKMFPQAESVYFQPWNKTATSRRKLGDFLGCAYCKCCNVDQTYCQSALPCCYSINCDAYPFGFCKFVPISCNCQGCGI